MRRRGDGRLAAGFDEQPAGDVPAGAQLPGDVPAGAKPAGDVPADDEFAGLRSLARRLGVEPAELPPVRRVEVATGAGRVSALHWGGGPAQVVFLHGLGREAHAFDAVAVALRVPAVALDLPGHGESEWRSDGRYVAATVAPAAAEAVRSLGAARLALVGHSLGGLAAIAVAAEVSAAEPGRVAGIVLLDVTPGLDPRRARALRAFVGGSAPAGPHDTRRGPDGRLVWKHHVATIEPRAVRPEDFAGLWAPLAAYEGRVVLVRGEGGFVEPAEVDELLRRQPTAAVVSMPGGHELHEERPLEVSAVLARLLGELGLG